MRIPCGCSAEFVARVQPLQLPTTHPVRAEVSKPLVTANQHLFRLSLSKPSPIGVGFRQAQPEQTLVDAKKRFDTSARTGGAGRPERKTNVGNCKGATPECAFTPRPEPRFH